MAIRRSQEERSAGTRLRILTAAIECLRRLGYVATTTVRVAEQAEVSRGAMLHHFPTKRDLMFAVTEHIMDLNHAFFVEEGGRIADGWERYARLPDLRWKLALQPHGIALMEIMVGARSDPSVREGYAAFQRQLSAKQQRRLAARAKAAGMVLTPEHQAVSRAIVFAIRGMSIEKQLNPDFDVEPVLAVLRNLRLRTMQESAGAADATLAADPLPTEG